MRWIPDRFWWAQRVLGVLLVVIAPGSLVWLIAQMLGLFNFGGLGAGWQMLVPLLIIGAILLVGVALGAAQLAGAFLTGVGYLMGASPARDRFRRRLRAIEGDQEAMQRAAIKIDAGSAPRLSDSTLELMWRPTLLLRVLVALMDLIFLPVFGFWAGSGVYIAYVIVGTNQEQQLFWLARIGLLLLVVSMLVVAPLVMMGLLLCSAPMLVGKPYGVIANDDEIVYRSVMTRRRYVLRWEEISLFEAQPAMKAGQMTYRLYGRGVIARWNDQPPSKGSTLGMSKEEFEQRHQALLDLIVARTGLLPRTLEKKLVEVSGI